jgi:hypothetical protein
MSGSNPRHRVEALRRSCRAAGFGRCARYIDVSVGGANFIAPFVPVESFWDWVQSTGGYGLPFLGVACWDF